MWRHALPIISFYSTYESPNSSSAMVVLIGMFRGLGWRLGERAGDQLGKVQDNAIAER